MGRTFLFLFGLALALLSTFHPAQANKCSRKGEPSGFHDYTIIGYMGDAWQCLDKCQKDPSCKYWLTKPSRFGFGLQDCRLSDQDFSNVGSHGGSNYLQGPRNCKRDCFGKGKPDGFAYYKNFAIYGASMDPMDCYKKCKSDTRCKYWMATKYPSDDFIDCDLSDNDYSDKRGIPDIFPVLFGAKNCKASKSDW